MLSEAVKWPFLIQSCCHRRRFGVRGVGRRRGRGVAHSSHLLSLERESGYVHDGPADEAGAVALFVDFVATTVAAVGRDFFVAHGG